MKICHLTSVHTPFDTRILYKECAGLLDAGHEVHLVAPHDRDETVRGIVIHAVPIRRSKLTRGILTTRGVYRKALALDADIYHFHDPELIPYGLLLKLRGKRVICDVHEDYPDYVRHKQVIPSLLRKPVAAATGVVEWFSCRFFDAVVTVTPKIQKRFERINPRTVEIRNFPLLEELGTSNTPIPMSVRDDAVFYVGGLTRDRGVREMVEAIGLANRERPVILHMGGRFPDEVFEREVRESPGFEHVRIHGFMSREVIATVMARVKAGIVYTHPRSHHQFAYMTKLFEYMAAGIPVIAADYPLWREIVEGAGSGILVPPMDTEALARAILHVLAHPAEAEEMGKRGRKAVEEEYNWECEETKLLDLYDRIGNRS